MRIARGSVWGATEQVLDVLAHVSPADGPVQPVIHGFIQTTAAGTPDHTPTRLVQLRHRGPLPAFGRFEMFTIRQILVRIRQGDRDREIAVSLSMP